MLGHYLSFEGIELDEEKLKCALEISVPKTGRDVQSFLGLANFFRDFTPNYAKITKPLDDLRKCGNIGDLWNEEKQNAFVTIKKLLCNAPILSFPYHNKTFYVATDASNYAIGAVLFQAKNNNSSNTFENNVAYIKFASRSLTKCEQSYPISKRELLGIVFAITKFENYLLGRQFKILTDHEPLTYLLSQKRLGQLQTAWLDTLLRFNFEIIYIPGGDNLLPDLLSRINPSSEIDIQTPLICDSLKDNSANNQIQVASSATAHNIFTVSTNLNSVGNPIIELPQSNKNEITYLNNTNLTSEDLQSNSASAINSKFNSANKNIKLIEDLHEITHESYEKLYKKCIDSGYNWENLRNDCIEVVKKCTRCLRFSISKRGFHPQANIHSNLPMKHVAMDLLGPLPSDNNQTFILILIDIFSRYIFLRNLRDKSALSVATALYSIFCEYGHPVII